MKRFHAVCSKRLVLETSNLLVCYASDVLKWHVPPCEIAVLMCKTLPVAMRCALLQPLISAFSEMSFSNLLLVLFHFNVLIMVSILQNTFWVFCFSCL